MKVVFLEEVEGTASTGDVKNVADGFARNYLLPRKLAAPATEHYIAIAGQKATKQARRQDRLDEEARDHLLPSVEGRSITIEVHVGEQDKLFGSVTARDIAERIQEEMKVELEHRQVGIPQPIRELGPHEVPVKLTKNVIANVTVIVQPIGGFPEPEEEEAEAGEAAEGEGEGAAAEAEGAEEATTEAAADEAPAAEATTEDAPAEALAEEAPAATEEENATDETSDAPEAPPDEEERGDASQDGS